MLRIRLHNPHRIWTAAVRTGGRVVPEWPPAPWRLVAALTAGAHRLDEATCSQARAVLARIAACEQPSMWLPGAYRQEMPDTFVPAAFIDNAPRQPVGKLAERGLAVAGLDDVRTKKALSSARMEWDHPCVFVDVPIELDETETAVLADAARRVGYVGRATHPINVGILTPGASGWVDHTSADGLCDAEQIGPGAGHTAWSPVEHEGAQVRGWTAGMLEVLDEDHDQRYRRGLPGVANGVKGTTVGYAPRTGRRRPSGWVPVGLARPTTDVAGVTGRVNTARPVGTDPAVPMLRGRRLVGLLFADHEAAAAAQRAAPDLLTGESPPGGVLARQFGPSTTWSTDTPIVAHPDRRLAQAEIAAVLAERGITAMVQLTPVSPSHTHPGMHLWRALLTADEAITGPVRLGPGAEQGDGTLTSSNGGGGQ